MDVNERKLALDNTQSFIVQAPAGSGKTSLLIARFLKLLATSCNSPEEIVAVTFTRKATNEMRNRIIDALHMAQGEPPESKHELSTYNLAKQVLQRSSELQWGLIDNPSRLKIFTIDSLAGNISAKQPLLSQMGGAPQVIDNPRALYLEAINNLFASTNQDDINNLKLLLTYLDNNLSLCENYLADLLGKREQWLASLYSATSNVNEYFSQILANQIDARLNNIASMLPASWRYDMWPAIQKAAINMHSQDISSSLVALQDNSSWPRPCADNAKQWVAIIDWMLTKDAKKPAFRKSFTIKQGVLPKSAGKTKIQKDEYAAHKDSITSLLESLSPKVASELNWLRMLPLEVCHIQVELIQVLCQILPLLVAHLKLVFQQHGVTDFIEVNTSAIAALDNITESDSMFILDHTIQHMLIDEYQDISQTQYQLFSCIVSGWEPGDGRTLFIVGDPMQSIYRFRGAEVGVFLYTKEFGVGNIKPASIVLKQNFRSQQNLVAWVNSACDNFFPANDSINTGEVKYTPKHAGSNIVIPWPVRTYATNSDSEQLLAIAENIKSILAEDKNATIAVLGRTRNILAMVAAQLREQDLEFSALDLNCLLDCAHVFDSVNLLQAVLDTTDNLAWFCLLRSPLFGLTLKEMECIANFSDEDTYIKLSNNDCITQLSTDNYQRVVYFMQHVKYWRDNIGRKRLSLWLKSLWQVCHGNKCYSGANIQADLELLYQIIDKNSASELRVDVELIFSELEKVFSSTQNASARVELMTMHKSKGLEFDYVFLPFLDKQIKSSTNDLLLFEESLQHNHSEFLLAAKSKGQDNQWYNYLSNLINFKHKAETSRLLYVALTRAKKHLYLFATNSNDYKWSANSLMDYLAPNVEIIEQNFDTKTHSVVANSLARLKYQEQLFVLPEYPEEDNEDLNIPEYPQHKAAAIGTVFHALVENINHSKLMALTADKINKITKNPLLRQGLTHACLNDATKLICRAITNMQQDANVAWFLDDNNEKYSEYSFYQYHFAIYHEFRADYIFRDSNKQLWIIDYKMSSDKGFAIDTEIELYCKQLYNYQQSLAKIMGENINIALYFPLVPLLHKL